jgi:hypothetical protein
MFTKDDFISEKPTSQPETESARARARMMATRSLRWCFAQVPEMRRGSTLARSGTKEASSSRPVVDVVDLVAQNLQTLRRRKSERRWRLRASPVLDAAPRRGCLRLLGSNGMATSIPSSHLHRRRWWPDAPTDRAGGAGARPRRRSWNVCRRAPCARRRAAPRPRGRRDGG